MGISDEIKSGIYTGIGFMLKGKEKVEEAAKEFIKDKNMSTEEGEKFVKEIVTKANETKEEITQYLDERIKTTMDKAGYVKKEEYDAIKKELEELKSKINNQQ